MKKMKKGFTIVELVIVIGVIAILSAILIPTFVSLTDKANKARASQEVSDAYTQYVVHESDIEEGGSGAPLAQSQVVVERVSGSDSVIYMYEDGAWVEGGTKSTAEGHTGLLFEVGDGNDSIEDGELGVYERA